MPINFFDNACQILTEATVFGLYDPPGTLPARVDLNSEHQWVAIVSNEMQQQITFTAIDNCLEILRENGDQEKNCDAMLTYVDNIIFVELKEVTKDWIPDGIEQLRITIDTFGVNHDLTAFLKRMAFLANKRHPNFHFSHKEAMEAFRKRTTVRLIIGAQIKI